MGGIDWPAVRALTNWSGAVAGLLLIAASLALGLLCAAAGLACSRVIFRRRRG